MRFTSSARKHGLSEQDVRAVLAAPLRSVPQELRGAGVVLHIGVLDNRDLVEVVVAPGAAPGEPPVVLHAMRLTPSNYRYLDPSA